MFHVIYSQREEHEEELASAEENGSFFFLAFKKERDTSGKIGGLVKFLRDNSNKIGKITVGPIGTQGFLVAMADVDRQFTDGLNGFKCFFVPKDDSVFKSDFGTVSVSKRGGAQKAAADHYNELQRDKARIITVKLTTHQYGFGYLLSMSRFQFIRLTVLPFDTLHSGHQALLANFPHA
jgi:hypothetical protein